MTSHYLSHYALLRVALDAPAAEIERAYQRRLAALPTGRWRQRLWLWANGESPQSLRRARDVLCHAHARARYDRELANERWHWIPMA